MDIQARARSLPLVATVMALTFPLSGCRVIGDIFKAGVGVGVVAVILVSGLIAGLAALFMRGARGA